MERLQHSLTRTLGIGAQQLWRNGFLSLSTLLIGAVILFLLNVLFATKAFTDLHLQQLQQRADFIVLLQESYDPFNAAALVNDLQGLSITAEELSATTYNDVTLPPRLRLIFRDLTQVDAAFQVLEKERYDTVLDGWDTELQHDFQRIVERLFFLQRVVTQLSRGAVVLFIIAGGVLMLNAFRMSLFTRRKEIYIARLVGARLPFITLPYYGEALLLSVGSCLIAIPCFIWFLTRIQLSGVANVFGVLWATVFPWQLLGAVVVAIVGAWVALQPYVRGKFQW
ncbi:hypothetical protein H6771_01230 [Candidatus Peribacteria bacterium]|nr:hypothetical protein [Candidatus Peribacteria bacterium]